MRSHLKVKVFSLAAEMSFIRRQELKWKDKARAARQREKINSNPEIKERAAGAVTYCENNFWSQRNHRDHMKADARWSHLAYGFMKGRSYSQMEYICYGDVKGFGSTAPNWGRIEEIVAKFSQDEPELPAIMQKFSEWKADALVWYDDNPSRITRVNLARETIRAGIANNAEYQAARKADHENAKAYGLQAAAEGWVKRGRKWKKVA